MNQTASPRLSRLRRDALEYWANPSKYLDLSSVVEYDEDCGRFLINGMSFADALGIQRLGSGCYATVYALDDKRVLKVIKTQDTGYARYVKFCKANKTNQHLPKIYYSGVWGEKQVYILERLRECRQSDDYYSGNISADNKMISSFRSLLRGREKNPFITKDAQDLVDFLGDGDNDLHSGNFMFRGDTLVVTDPFSQ